MVGQFKDDQLQSHKHNINCTSSQATTTAWAIDQTFTGNYTKESSRFLETVGARIGTVTHRKQKGVKYIIKVL